MLIVLSIWNICVFILYGIDKWKAIHKRYRISEKTLLLTSILCGGLGGTLAMQIFHHKTRKYYFYLANFSGIILLYFIYKYIVEK